MTKPEELRRQRTFLVQEIILRDEVIRHLAEAERRAKDSEGRILVIEPILRPGGYDQGLY